MVFSVNNSNNRFTLRLTVTETGTDVNSNTSTLSYSLDLISNSAYDFAQYSIGRSVSINGSTVYYVARADSPGLSLAKYGTLNLGSGTTTITHEADGSKTISLAYSIDMASASYTPGPLSGSGSMTLTTIPRASKLGGISNFDVDGSIAVYITKYAAGFTDYLDIYFGSNASGTLIKTVGGIISGAAVSFTEAERSRIYGLMSTVKSGTFYFELLSYNGSTWLGTDTRTATGSISNADPSLSASVVDVNSATIALTGSATKLVRYRSTARVTISASGNKGATIASKVVNGTAVSGTTLDIANISTTPLVVTVTDSRGNSSSVTLNPEVVPYISLTLSASFRRPAPTTGEVVCSFSGNYFEGSFGVSSNTLTLRWAYRLKGAASWTTGGTFSLGTHYTISGSTFSSAGEISLGSGFDYEGNYEFAMYYVDALTDAASGVITVTKGIPVFDWGEHDFNVNGQFMFNLVEQPGIVEAGDDGMWKWRKYSDGTAILYGRTSWKTQAVNPWGNVYSTGDTDIFIPAIPYPFTFIYEPLCFATPVFNTGNWWLATQGYGWKTQSPSFQAIRATAATITGAADLLVIGKWK